MLLCVFCGRFRLSGQNVCVSLAFFPLKKLVSEMVSKITFYVNFLHQCIHLTDFGFGGMSPGWPS